MNGLVQLMADVAILAWETSGMPHSSIGEIGLLVTISAAAVAFFLPLGLAVRKRRRQRRVESP